MDQSNCRSRDSQGPIPDETTSKKGCTWLICIESHRLK